MPARPFERCHGVEAFLVVAELIRQCLNGIRVAKLSERLHRRTAQRRVARVDVVDQRVADCSQLVRSGFSRTAGGQADRSEQRREIDRFGAHSRVVVAQAPRPAPFSTCGGTARAFSASWPVAADSPPATVLTSTTNPIILRRGIGARRKQRPLGVDRGELHAIVRILERRRDGRGRFGVVGVLQNLNGAQARRTS